MFAKKNLSGASCDRSSIGRREAAYEPSPIDSSTRRVKQIELWMTAVGFSDQFDFNSPRFGLFHNKIGVDQWRFDV
jgi:hypothetical protein